MLTTLPDSVPTNPIKDYGVAKPFGDTIISVSHLSKCIFYQSLENMTTGERGTHLQQCHPVDFSIPGSDSKVCALGDIHLCSDSEFYPIKKGEFIILRGPSGGGKTTLLNILGTLDIASEGQVEILGETIDASSSDAYLSSLRLRRIGFVFQTFNLLATMSAFENVELPMTILGILSKSERRKRAIKLLETVGLQDRLNHLPSELSGGEQQRVYVLLFNALFSRDFEEILLHEFFY